jgi:hypothetical protein
MATDEEEVPRFSLRRGARFLESFREGAGSGDADEEWLAGLRHDLDEAEARLEGSDHEAIEAVEAEAVEAEEEPEAAPEPPALEEPELPILAAREAERQTDTRDGPGGQDYKTMLDELVAGALAQPDQDPEPPPAPAEPVAFPAEPVAARPAAPPSAHGADLVPGLPEALTILADRLSTLEEALARAAAACTVTRTVLGHGKALIDHPANASRAQPPTASQSEAEVVDLRHRVAPADPLDPQ